MQHNMMDLQYIIDSREDLDRRLSLLHDMLTERVKNCTIAISRNSEDGVVSSFTISVKTIGLDSNIYQTETRLDAITLLDGSLYYLSESISKEAIESLAPCIFLN